MLKRFGCEWILLIGLVCLALPAPLRAEDLAQTALSLFPADTLRIEFSNPSALRKLPNYQTLRRRYEGPKLQELEDSFSKLGVQEADVDELLLGWSLNVDTWNFYGLAKGRFDAEALMSRAAGQGLQPVLIGDSTAYCPVADATANCLVLLDNTLGAFGTRQSLEAILAARAGTAPALSSDSVFVSLVDAAGSTGTIRGVARGAAVADWFRGWIPNQSDLKLDWTKAFKDVDSLAYSVETAESVQLKVQLNCTSNETAASLRQVLEGLRLFQQLTWQNQFPSVPNPYKNLEIQASGRQVRIDLETPYSALQMS